MNQAKHVFDNVLEVTGHTPMVRLNRLFADKPVEVWAKLEYYNPGGSIKDRIAIRMISEAEKSGRIKPGDTIIEATSGNTGIGLALACAVKGYKLIICMPMKMSMEKQVTMEALGATIVRTRTEARHDEPDSLFGVAKKLNSEIPNSHILDQYGNPDNPAAHYHGTGVEILEQMDAKIDYCVMSAGTGGTITGVGRRLKESIPNIQIVGADPEGSILGGGEPGAPYLVEGIGYDFYPDVFDPDIADWWVKTNDVESFRWARRCIKEEGMLIGGSSGSALQATAEVVNRCKGGERIVVVMPDSIRNYMSKFLNNDWLMEKGISL